jgi:hypothetical protein
VEFWLRMNFNETNPKGYVSILFGQTLGSLSGGPWELGIGQYDDKLRIYVAGKWIDVPLPELWMVQESNFTDINGQQH